MPLFVVQHQHLPDTCPAAPGAGAQLLVHISAATATRHRVTIQAEAVLDGEHCLLLVVQAPDREHVERFMAVLGRGRVQVLPASSAEDAVARGGCLAETAATP